MVSESESSCATERSYEVKYISPHPSPDIEVLEEGSVVGASGPKPTVMPTSQNIADVTKNLRAKEHSDLTSQVQFTI